MARLLQLEPLRNNEPAGEMVALYPLASDHRELADLIVVGTSGAGGQSRSLSIRRASGQAEEL